MARVDYSITADPEKAEYRISLTFPAKGSVTTVSMPNWSPGNYMLFENYKRVMGLKVSDRSGEITRIAAIDNKWKFANAPSGDITVSYSTPMIVQDGAVMLTGPTILLYVVGRAQEETSLKLNLPKDWNVALGLKETMPGSRTYRAASYDVLADNPIAMGDVVIDSYMSGGKPHHIALRGSARDRTDRKALLDYCKKLTDAQIKFFGGYPDNLYVFQFAVGDRFDGGGGLEHLSSTAITLASGLGPGIVSVISHEYFHLWNVKRIRTAVLGPFDYDVMPKTGGLWWLEGVTDYYAHLFLTRSGIEDESAFTQELMQQLATIQGNPAYKEVSPYEASYRVGEANNGRGNSNGYRISYYNLGFVAGFCLDAEIRSLTNGKRSLDDVTLNLWRKCKDDQPGLPEDGFRTALIEVGGPAMGSYYDAVIMKPGAFDVPAQAAKLGYTLTEKDVVTPSLGFSPRMVGEKGGLIINVQRPRGGNQAPPAQGEGSPFMSGDVITSVGSQSLMFKTTSEVRAGFEKWQKSAKPGEKVKVELLRDGKPMTIEVTVAGVTRKRTIWTADEKKSHLRKGWLTN